MRPHALGMLLLAAVTLPSLASDSATLQVPRLRLSEDLNLTWSRDLSAVPAPMVGLGAYLFHGSLEGKDFTVWVQRTEPTRLANLFSARRLWKENLAAASKLQRSTKDSGCREIKSGFVGCEHGAREKNGAHVHEGLFWRMKSDLVLIKVSSEFGAAHASQVYARFQLQGGSPQ